MQGTNKHVRFEPLRVSTEYGDLVLDESTGKYWHLNESATRVLNVFEHGGSQEDAVADFVETYGIAPERARADIETASAELRKLGLL